MVRRKEDSEIFIKSLNALTGISLKKIKNYSKGNTPFNILEHPMVVEPNEKQLTKINMLNEFISSYKVLRMKEEQEQIRFGCPSESGEYFLSLLGGMKDRERFMIAFLDNNNHIIETRVVSEGTVDMAAVYPRDILKIAIANDCSGMILSHNHPGKSLIFSREDIEITQKMVDIFHPLNIRVLDHIVVGGNQYSSLAEKGCLPNMPLNKARYEPIPLSDMIKEDIEDDSLYYDDDEELGL
ncbi:JAB domain-containing protein [Vallitalea guaymasensis]|uniref:JAB domain-containing protein n=1 Tax=Vallitalea guaymasensis TaxID=1185412 RepID=A0A8J8MDT0_9FIRM|nr:JAB domain-containing protein [Vallitalea guaymasensis]QUH31097.1 JAB domain-containing protein [Vallitalea guaymasensis]